MADGEDVQPLVCDNGSGMVKNRDAKEQIGGLEKKIEGVKETIEKVGEQIKGVEEQIKMCSDLEERAPLWAEKAQLRVETAQLRAKKEQLWAEKAQLQARLDVKEAQLLEQIQHRRTTAACHAGREKGLMSEWTEVRSDLTKLRSDLKNIFGLLHESFSCTRAASTISAGDLSILRHGLGVTLIPEEEEGVTLEALLGTQPLLGGKETEGGESFWDGLKDEYMQEFKNMTKKSRDVIWNDATGVTFKARMANGEFPVMNDLVLSLRRYRSPINVGAILGVEIKKLSWKGLRQTEVDYYVWANESLFPFIQLITDMEHGGVAIYSMGGSDVRLRTLGSMEALRDFVSGVVEHLPSRLGEDEDSGGIINPDTFTEPSRKCYRARALALRIHKVHNEVTLGEEDSGGIINPDTFTEPSR